MENPVQPHLPWRRLEIDVVRINTQLIINCFYKEAYWNKCKKKGHLARVCKAANPYSTPQSQGIETRRTQWVNRSPTPDDDLPLYCLDGHSAKPIIVDVNINGVWVPMEVDTGTAVSLMSRIVEEKLFPQASVQKSATTLWTYTGKAKRVIGELQVIVTYGSQTKT